MSDSSLPPDTKEQVFEAFFQELERADDKKAVADKYTAAHPEWSVEFYEEAALEEALAGSQSAAPPPVVDLPDFRIIREVARGGMGIVYEAEQRSLKRRVAVKIRQGQPAPGTYDRFRIEQEVLARLHQTHIVPIHTAGQAGPWQYFAMAYIEGATLSRVVRATRQFTRSRHGIKTPTLAELAGEVVKQSMSKSQDVVPESVAPAGQKGTPNGPRADHSRQSAQKEKDDALSAGQAARPFPTRVELSSDYFRSVARVMADAAEALEHAHTVDILHRDVKPSNIMVDTTGQCWLIDFGLARFHNGHGQAGSGTDKLTGTAHPALTEGPLGTPQYMAPEQYKAQADARSDVWGLGATLYEMLTLHPAFERGSPQELGKRIRLEDPEPARNLVGNIPPDLVAIYRKALHKEPGRRYQTAHEFGEDLHRWLCHEPTVARPARPPRRVFLWSRRNKGWATAVAVSLFAFIGFSGAGMLLVEKLGEMKIAVAVEETREKEREQEQQRRSLIQKIRLTAHTVGWSDEAWRLAREAAEIHKDGDLRNQTAATLLGLDARVEKRFDKWAGGSSVAFDATGRQLLVGGLFAHPQEHRAAEGAKVWDRERDKVVYTSSQKGPGPVAFRAEGTPLQLVANPDDRLTLLLWDVAGDRLIRSFKIRDEGPREPLTPANSPNLVMTPDGSFVAATIILRDGNAALVIWDAGSGKMVYRSADRVSALALSLDHTLLATGDEDGHIVLRSLPKGERVASWSGDRMEIQCLAFQRDRRQREAKPRLVEGWLLAAGDASGTITIWDCARGVPRSVCRGSSYQVNVLAFSPDGMTLASTGRFVAKLWDVASGRLLLDVGLSNWMTGVAFSPDGRRLAGSGIYAFLTPGLVGVWELETGRGVQTLRGLTSPVEKVLLSPDERFLAALAHDSRVAVWDRHTEKLLHVFKAPKPAWVDNAALAFSPDGRQLAFTGSSTTTGRAKLWDVVTGKELRSWTFAPGMNNILAFHPPKNLLLFQIETRDGKHILDDAVDLRVNPPVARVRDLFGDPQKHLFEINEFDRGIDGPCAPEDGRFFALVGYQGWDKKRRQAKAFDGLTGKELWSSAPETEGLNERNLSVGLDRAGRFLTLVRAPRLGPEPAEATLLEMPSGKYLGLSEPCNAMTGGWSPDMPYWMSVSHDTYVRPVCLIRRGEKEPVVVLGIDGPVSGTHYQFNATGTRFAWGNVDGTVNVADIPAVQRRLAALGLGW